MSGNPTIHVFAISWLKRSWYHKRIQHKTHLWSLWSLSTKTACQNVRENVWILQCHGNGSINKCTFFFFFLLQLELHLNQSFSRKLLNCPCNFSNGEVEWAEKYRKESFVFGTEQQAEEAGQMTQGKRWAWMEFWGQKDQQADTRGV